jgi:hypothetical protein
MEAEGVFINGRFRTFEEMDQNLKAKDAARMEGRKALKELSDSEAARLPVPSSDRSIKALLRSPCSFIRRIF